MRHFRYLEDAAILRLDTDTCIGCGNCALVCPHRIFVLKEGKAEIIDRGACMECGACATNCPVGAIYVNPDDGCGCAAYIINSWIAKVRGKVPSGCGC
jgi:ferredoxin